MKKILKPLLIVIVIITLGAFLIKPTLKNISYGIDLQGGFEILYKIEPLEKGKELTEEDLDKTYTAIVNRIDTLGVSEPVIAFEGNNLIRIQLPGVSNEEEARQRISTTAVLSFRDTNDKLLMTSDILGNNGASLTQDSKSFQYEVKLDIKDTAKFYEVTKKISQRTNGNNMIVIWLDYNEELDSYENEKLTCGKDSNMKCISAASVKEGLDGGSVVIQGNFTKEEAQTLVDLINSGSLPTKLSEEATPKSVSPSFGAETITKTGIAGIITFILISLILVFKYRISGLIGSVCLFVYALLVFIIYNAVGGVLTLTGIAALVLGIGMAVDSIIISNDRIKDELRKGKKLIPAVNEGSKSSLKAIIDANVTTLLVGIILYIFGESSVKGFATMLIITIFVTIFACVILYRVLQIMTVKTKVFNDNEKLFIGSVHEVRKFNYVKFAKKPIIVSLSIITIGLIFVLVRGFNFGVDFTGGTQINLSSSEPLNFNKIKEIVKDYDLRDYDTYLNSKTEGYLKLNDTLNEEDEIKVKSELKRFEMMPSASLEASLILNYVEWLLETPWFNKTEDNDDLNNVQKILDEDHYGLEEPKKRIVEYLAVKKMTNSLKAPILCFYGPPGCGKTSLGRSIARALGRKYFTCG